MKDNIMVFDVESNGLYGESFAVGAIVSDLTGIEIDRFELIATDVKITEDWVKENVIPHLNNMPKCKTSKELRSKFYNFYMKHKANCILFSDVNYPVETNFLSDVVADDEESRKWNMPYPLYDMVNFVDVNINREDIYTRDNAMLIAQDVAIRKLKKHNPFDDSKASLYCLLKFARSEVKRIMKESNN